MSKFPAKLGSSKSRKEKVNDHEQELAGKLKGVRQPNSGSLEHRKGDIKLDRFLFDSKETETNAIVISAKDLTKITREADGEQKKPGLVVTVETVPSTVAREWIMIPLDVFSAMLESGMDGEL